MANFFLSVAVLFFSIASAHAAPPHTELTLNLQYQVECGEQDPSAFPGLTGEVNFGARSIRFRLFRYLNQTEISLGAQATLSLADLSFHLDANPNCHLKHLTPSLHAESLDATVKSLAYAHSPFLVLRPDELRRPERDVPLGITYSIIPLRSGFRIRYTYYFSNESSRGLFSTSKAMSLGAYGRRSDIEWIYQVDFTAGGEVISRKRQGSILFGLGHQMHKFRGSFLAHSNHPILYNIAKHNVFGDQPPIGTLIYRKLGDHLIPREEIQSPDAREVWLWNHAWTFDVTDRELRRTGGLSWPSHEYLYVRLKGALFNRSIQVLADLNGTPVFAGEGQATIKILGEDLWGEETFSAIHLPELGGAISGAVQIRRKSNSSRLEMPRFFRLIENKELGFTVHELTDKFLCSDAYDCRF